MLTLSYQVLGERGGGSGLEQTGRHAPRHWGRMLSMCDRGATRRFRDMSLAGSGASGRNGIWHADRH
jgi:hypothetical protein